MNYFLGALFAIILFAAFIQLSHRQPHSAPVQCDHLHSQQC
jgi:hypothetical protein